MTNLTSAWFVIPAAGSGSRMQADMPKQYLPLLGSCVLAHTLTRVLAHERSAGCVLVLARDDKHWRDFEEYMRKRIAKPIVTCVGGDTRAESVLAGLRALPNAVQSRDFVFVHDAARPCVSMDALNRLFEALDLGANGANGAILAVRLQDSLKRADTNQIIQSSVDRRDLWRAQTPQAFRRAELERALVFALQNEHGRDNITDESSAMELQKVFAQMIESSDENLKITTPNDLLLAECILQRHIECAERMT